MDRRLLGFALLMLMGAPSLVAACERDTLLRAFACTDTVFAFEIVGPPEAIPYYYDVPDGDPLVATTHQVRLVAVFSSRSRPLAPGDVVRAGHYGGKVVWQGREIDSTLDPAPHLEPGRLYLGFAHYDADDDFFLFEEGATFMETSAGVRTIEDHTHVVSRLVAGYSVSSLLTHAEADQRAAEQRVEAAAARNRTLPPATRLADALIIYRLVLDTACPHSRGRQARPVVQQELSATPLRRYFQLMKDVEAQGGPPSPPSGLASSIGVPVALLDRLLAAHDVLLPDSAARALDAALLDAPTRIAMEEIDFGAAFEARFPAAARPHELSPIVYDDASRTALVLCSEGGGHLVVLSGITGSWTITVDRELWIY